jgi:hypothetical protein
MTEVDGRTRHYGGFYGVLDDQDERPLLLIWGNCQAEALRVVFDTVDGLSYRTVRVPAVHERVESDVPHVQRLAAETAVLLSQPIRAGYRDLPIGTDDVAALQPAGGKLMRWPVVRWSGLEPFSAIVRDPDDPGADPPVVPYHDLRTLAQAARGGAGEWDIDLPAETIRAVAEDGLAELRRREQQGTDVVVSDLLLQHGAGAMHTLNHPGNPVLLALAERVLDELSEPGRPVDPGRILLGTTKAPREARVLEALDLPAEDARTGWEHAGQTWSEDEVRTAQLAWYAERPAVVEAGKQRYANLIAQLGLDIG